MRRCRRAVREPGLRALPFGEEQHSLNIPFAHPVHGGFLEYDARRLAPEFDICGVVTQLAAARKAGGSEE